MKKLTNFILLTILFLFLTPSFTIAQNLQERVGQSDLIIEGKVIHKESYWNPEQTKIFTASTIEIYKILKGTLNEETIKLVSLGGIVGNDFQIIPHSFQTSVNDEGIFFTQNDDSQNNTFKANKFDNPFIAYSNHRGIFEASDGITTYQRTTDIYSAIENHVGMQASRVKSNTIEKAAKNWLDQNFAVSVSDTLIEFSFENIVVIGTQDVEFDVMVKSNQEGIKFAASNVFLNYSTAAFGESVVANQKISASKETVIENSVYALDLADEDINIAKLIVSSQSQPTEFYPLALTKEKLIHVIIDIENIFELANIEFDNFLMAEESFFYDEVLGEYISFDKIILGDPAFPFIIPQIEMIAPNPVPAGTRDDNHILNIHGNDFQDHNNADGTFDMSCTECKVRFRNGDASGGNWVYAVGTDIISWSNTDIFLRVPSATPVPNAVGGWLRPAASGAVRVEAPNGISTQNVDIHIPYSVLNIHTGLNPSSIAKRFAMSGQTANGIEFVYQDDVAPEIRNIFQDAAQTWCNETNIAWAISDNDLDINSDAANAGNDGMNIVSYQPDAEFTGSARAAVVITGHFTFCSADLIAYVRDVDVILKESSANPFEDDFYSKWYNRLLHELGHAHLLNHSINPSIPEFEEYIMIADLTNFNDVVHTIRDDDATGAETLFANSANLLGGCNDINPIFEGVNCDGVNEVADLPKHIVNLSLFPNPLEKEELSLSIGINADANIQLEIVSLLGQKIINRNLGKLSTGEHTISFPLPRETPVGNYFVKLYVDKELVTLKLLRI